MAMRSLVREVENDIARTRKNRKRKTADEEEFGQSIGARIGGGRNTLANQVSDLKDDIARTRKRKTADGEEFGQNIDEEAFGQNIDADRVSSPEWLESGVASSERELMLSDEDDTDYFAKKDTACISSHGVGYQWDEESGTCSISSQTT